jgi:hypothetical protein
MGGNGSGDEESQELKKKIDELNKRLGDRLQNGEKTGEQAGKRKAARQALKKLEKDCLSRLEKYVEQTAVLAGRKSYSKTDPDATCMRMKEDRGAEKAWPKPAYNIQLGTEGQFVVGYSVHNCSSDPICLVPTWKD